MRKVFTARPYQDMIIDHILATKRCAVWSGMDGTLTYSTSSTTMSVTQRAFNRFIARSKGNEKLKTPRDICT